MNILILGKDGQVGRALQSALAPLGRLLACGRGEADLTRPDNLRRVIAECAPAFVVNAAAYTAVDQAEVDEDVAMAVNGAGPAMLAHACRDAGAWLVHYSTDYVFDGQQLDAYLEADPTGPVNAYGRSKLAGEQGIVSADGVHLILRTSWVFDAHGSNFLKTMLRLASERSRLDVVDNQFGAPTHAGRLAQATALMIYRLATDAALARQASGIYHVTAGGRTSWHGYAREVVARAQAGGAALKAAPEHVYPVPAAFYPTPASRPVNSTLDTAKLYRVFGLRLPDWREDVYRMVDQLIQRRMHDA